MRSFVAVHVHWLWLILHKIRHPYSAATLGLFLAVGTLQILVAVLGGALAAEALTTNDSRKRRLKAAFWALGMLLFITTAWTGLLNDESQRATDGRTDDLKTQLTELSNSILSVSQLRAEIKTVPTNVPQTPAQQKLAIQLQQAINRTNDLAKRYSTVPPAPNSTSQPSVPTPAPQAPPQSIFPQPQSRSIVPTPASLQTNIEQTLKKLADIDDNADRSVQGTLSPIRSMYKTGGGGVAGPNHQYRDQAFQSTRPQLESIVKHRNDAFQRLLPEINQERTDAHRLLKLSGPDVAADQAVFDTVLEKSNAKITYPDNWPKAMPLYGLRYSDMRVYLFALQQQLKTLQ